MPSSSSCPKRPAKPCSTTGNWRQQLAGSQADLAARQIDIKRLKTDLSEEKDCAEKLQKGYRPPTPPGAQYINNHGSYSGHGPQKRRHWMSDDVADCWGNHGCDSVAGGSRPGQAHLRLSPPAAALQRLELQAPMCAQPW